MYTKTLIEMEDKIEKEVWSWKIRQLKDFLKGTRIKITYVDENRAYTYKASVSAAPTLTENRLS